MMRYADLRMHLSSWWAGIFNQARVSRAGEGASTLDTVRMVEPTASSPEQVIELTRLEQYGDVTCPPADTNAATWIKGDGGYVMPLGSPSVRPTDAKPGDRGLYNDAGARVHLYGSKSSSPGDVVVNGGTQKVARVNDRAKVTIRSVYTIPNPMIPAVYQLTVSAVSGTTSTILFQFTGTGAVTIPTAPGVSYDVEVDSTIFEGAPHFKA